MVRIFSSHLERVYMVRRKVRTYAFTPCFVVSSFPPGPEQQDHDLIKWIIILTKIFLSMRNFSQTLARNPFNPLLAYMTLVLNSLNGLIHKYITCPHKSRFHYMGVCFWQCTYNFGTKFMILVPVFCVIRKYEVKYSVNLLFLVYYFDLSLFQ